MTGEQRLRLDSKALGLALGTLWAALVVLLAFTSRSGWGEEWRALLADVYLGYDETNTGAAIGAVWAFLDAFAIGTLLGWLYNRFL
ncbi:MAG: bacteriophage holin [Halobacteriota archaeon]